MYGSVGDDSHRIGENFISRETATAAPSSKHDSHDSHSTYTHSKITNLNEKSYDVGCDSDRKIELFYVSVVDENNPYLYEEDEAPTGAKVEALIEAVADNKANI